MSRGDEANFDFDESVAIGEYTTSGEATGAHVERSDYCAVPAAGVVGEAMVAMSFGRCVVGKIRRRYDV